MVTACECGLPSPPRSLNTASQLTVPHISRQAELGLVRGKVAGGGFCFSISPGCLLAFLTTRCP